MVLLVLERTVAVLVESFDVVPLLHVVLLLEPGLMINVLHPVEVLYLMRVRCRHKLIVVQLVEVVVHKKCSRVAADPGEDEIYDCDRDHEEPDRRWRKLIQELAYVVPCIGI